MLRKKGSIVMSVSLVIALFTLPSLAEGPAETGIEGKEQPFPESTSLWKVETETSVVYIMGSIHLLKKEDFPLHPKMQAAYEEARTLVFETNLDSARTPGFQHYVFMKALYDSGMTLKKQLGDSVYGLLGDEMAPLGLDIDQLSQFEPWVVSITYVGVKLGQLGFDPDFGADVHFYEKAKSDGKNILALETPQSQIDLFDQMPPSQQKALLLQTLEQAADIEELLGEIILYWKAGDLDGLETTINKSLNAYPEIRKSVLSDRNRRWMEHIEAYLNSRGKFLVVVGVAHMSGEDGLLNLLKEAGYRVAQM